ncbi:nuclear factor 7, brain [Trichomycterus rosablanca]|uniref:nuclear factor 7, brain n=1 Tax=Trichomycterus rosablanca TaxID=2290929 RepID=UPI002F35E52F
MFVFTELAEMAEEDRTAQLPQADPFSLTSVTQPFPPSPNTKRKTEGTTNKCSEEQLSYWLDQLEKESKKTEAHMASLKKRQVNLSTSLESMEQQVRERFDTMRLALEKDELSVLNSLQQEHRENSSKLSRVLQDWNQHLKLVRKHISTIKKLQEDKAESQQQVYCKDFSCHKKQDATEVALKLNEEKFKKLMKVLGKISKDLQVQLQRKSLLLESTVVVIDRTASHRQIQVTSGRKCMHLSPDDTPVPDHPLQFDQIYCALGSPAITTGQHYWEVDVHCCPAWSVGLAYGSLHRKGHDKSTKLGKNRLSWCLEFRDGHLSAWHNDRHVALDKAGRAEQGALVKVGVFVNYQKGRVTFYDADSMKMLQEFSTSCSNMFDRAHHQFTEPVFPAFRFFKPRDRHAVPDHMEICDLSI